MKKLRIIIPAIVIILILVGLFTCKKKGAGPAFGTNTEEKQTVMVEKLVPRDLNEYITVSGKLEGSSDVMMVSETSGSIIKLYKKLGDRVEKNERIGEVSNIEFGLRLEQAKAAQTAAEAVLTSSRTRTMMPMAMGRHICVPG